MKIKINKFSKLIILSLILSFFQLGIQYKNNTVFASAQSQAECVIEVSSGRVLYSKNESKILPMASTTKVLTAITVIDNFDVNKMVTIPKTAVGIEGSSIYLREGEKLTVKELLYGLMLRSGNDTAEALAQTLTKTRSDFIALMNETAKKYGATNSNFTNPHGLHDENHYTTAYDLAIISANAMKNEVFREIVSTKRIEISNDGYDYKRVLINKNKMLTQVAGATGIKTGFTKKAGRCLVSSVKRNGFEVVSVVLNSPDMWNRSTEIISNAFNEYKYVKVLDKTEFNDVVYTTSKNKKMCLNVLNDFYYPLRSNEISSVEFKINGLTIENYVKKPENIAEFQIFIKNELIFSQKVFSIYNRYLN